MDGRPARSFLLIVVLFTSSLKAAQQPAEATSPESSGPPLGGGQTAASGQERAAEPQKPACEDPNEGLIYPAVHASYIGGTVLRMPQTMSVGLGNFIPYQARQYRVKGRLAMGPCSMVFAFKVKGGGTGNGSQSSKEEPKEESHASYKMLRCGPPDVMLSFGQLCGCPKTKAGTGKACTDASDVRLIQIPYDPVIVLSRARKLPTELTADTTAYLTTAAAVLTAILGSFSVSHDKLVYGGITVAAGMVAYIFLIKRPAQSENYIVVFVRKSSETSGGVQGDAGQDKASGAASATIIRANGSVVELPQQAKASSDEALFKKGSVIILKIPNYHDYYNISMILNGKTGLEFAAESAEKGGAATK